MHALDDNNQCIGFDEKTPEFTSVVVIYIISIPPTALSQSMENEHTYCFQ